MPDEEIEYIVTDSYDLFDTLPDDEGSFDDCLDDYLDDIF